MMPDPRPKLSGFLIGAIPLLMGFTAADASINPPSKISHSVIFALIDELPSGPTEIQVGQPVLLKIDNDIFVDCRLRIAKGTRAQGLVNSLDMKENRATIRVLAIEGRGKAIPVSHNLVLYSRLVPLGRFATPETSAFIPKGNGMYAQIDAEDFAQMIAKFPDDGPFVKECYAPRLAR